MGERKRATRQMSSVERLKICSIILEVLRSSFHGGLTPTAVPIVYLRIRPPPWDGFPRFEPGIGHPARSPIATTPPPPYDPPPHLPPAAIQSWPDTDTMTSSPMKALPYGSRPAGTRRIAASTLWTSPRPPAAVGACRTCSTGCWFFLVGGGGRSGGQKPGGPGGRR